MRLLNTQTYRLHEFMGYVPPYAILSHRWGEDEVSFKFLHEYQNSIEDDQSVVDEEEDPTTLAILAALRRRRHKKLASTAGWVKVTRFCDEARILGLEYAWIDTCCIDQSSSAELQEAINSMFKWYQHAGICIVYLSDVERSFHQEEGDTMTQFCASQWFTRGWTLQELIASLSSIQFRDCNWSSLGDAKTLMSSVSRASGIDEVTLGRLYDPSYLRNICVAQRMSWASRRQTTRPEDRAYCLLGIFDVNMTLMYGEGGAQSFTRLQLEIMSQTTDESLLVWNTHAANDNDLMFRLYHPALPSSPDCFEGTREISRISSRSYARANPQKTKNPYGLKLELTLVPITAMKALEQMALPYMRNMQDHVFVAPLLCSCSSSARSATTAATASNQSTVVFIFLRRQVRKLEIYRRFGPWVEAPCYLGPLRAKYSSTEVIISMLGAETKFGVDE